MSAHRFDRIARLLSRAGSRRRALAALGALALARPIPASAASQIETAACGEAGAVCTPIKGCCEGMVCATSYTNPAYGVCVTGEGDMLAVSDDIVVPGAEGVTDELAQLVTDAAGTDAESILAAQEAEIQSRKDARRARNATQQSRRRSNHSTQQSRRTANHGDTHEKKLANQAEKELARDLRGAPHLKLRFTSTSDPDVLRVNNREDITVGISRVESTQRPGPHYNQLITIPAGETHYLYSGPGAEDADDGDPKVTAWTDIDVCPSHEGIALTAFKFGDSRTHRLTVLCPP